MLIPAHWQRCALATHSLTARPDDQEFGWGPTVDGVFLPDAPQKLLADGRLNPGVGVLWGTNTNDSIEVPGGLLCQ